jgi:signal transduction histidine kinase/ActR/RegA family two-component response regulator
MMATVSGPTNQLQSLPPQLLDPGWLESLPLGIFLYEEGEFRFMNRKFMELTGLEEDAPSGRVAGLFPNDCLHLLEELSRGGVSGKRSLCLELKRDTVRTPVEITLVQTEHNAQRPVWGYMHSLTHNRSWESFQLRALYKLAKISSSTVEPNNLLQLIASCAEELTGAEECNIFRLDPTSKRLKAIYSDNKEFQEQILSFSLELDEGLAGWVASHAEGRVVNYDDSDKISKQIPGTPVEVESLAAAPLIARGRVIGVIVLYKMGQKEFHEGDLELLTILAEQIAGAVDKALLVQTAEKYAAKSRLVGEIGLHINSLLDSDQVLKQVVRLIRRSFGYESVTIALKEKEKLVVKAIASASESNIHPGLKLDLNGPGIVAAVAREGSFRNCPNTAEDPLFMNLSGDENVRSELAVPIVSKGEILGVLDLQSEREYAFSGEDVATAHDLANQAALALENAKLYSQTRQRNEQINLAWEIGKKINSILNLDELLSEVVELIADSFDYYYACISLVEGNYVVFKKGHGKRQIPFEKKNLRMEIGKEGIGGWVAAHSQPLLVNNVSKDPRYYAVEELKETKAELCVPIRTPEKVIGVIDIQSNVLGAFDPSDLHLMELVASQVSIALENARLFDNLKQAYDKLKQTQAQLVQSEKLKALGEMASGVAHDFNNVLGAILGRAQLLQTKTKDPELVRSLKFIEVAATDGAQTVRRIQDFTRTRTERNFRAVDMNQLIESSLDMTKHKWKNEMVERGVMLEVQTDFVKPPPPLMGNPVELKEVLTNLIINAIEAMPNGGLLKISSSEDENFGIVEVSDTGVGMSEEVQRKIFDPFFTTKGPKGTGLGLSVTYGIVTRHYGAITVRSEPTGGTKFTIKLPKEKEVREPEGRKTLAAVSDRHAKVLLIDDEQAILQLTSEILQENGHRTSCAHSGKQGIEMMKQEDFDIVITDLVMPDLSGWQVAQAIKEVNANTVIILATGWGTQLDRDKLSMSDIDLLLPKPSKLNDILRTVSEALLLKMKRDGRGDQASPEATSPS